MDTERPDVAPEPTLRPRFPALHVGLTNITQYLVVKIAQRWHFSREGRRRTRCNIDLSADAAPEEYTSLYGDEFCPACLKRAYTCPACENHISTCLDHETGCTFHDEACTAGLHDI